jgi:DME family drug/metabolite transporter
MTEESRSGPWLVALGAALWGTESAWRIPLGTKLDANVLVFWEHVILVAIALPWIVPRLGELRRVRGRAIAWLVFSGVAGSAVGAVLFTRALKEGNATVANVVLNVQPLISTTAAVVLFGDRLGRAFWPWAALAVVSGFVLVALKPGFEIALDAGTPYALACAACWGMSTVAGRAVMTEMSLPLAAGLRVVIGLVCMVAIVAVEGSMNASALWPAAARDDAFEVITWLVLLASLSGWVPLLVYFAGLARTRASTAGYFEMMQTLAAAAITWGFFAERLVAFQVVAAVLLIAAVAMVQRAQERLA